MFWVALVLEGEGGMQKQKVRILTILGEGWLWGEGRWRPPEKQVEVPAGWSGRRCEHGGLFVL